MGLHEGAPKADLNDDRIMFNSLLYHEMFKSKMSIRFCRELICRERAVERVVIADSTSGGFLQLLKPVLRLSYTANTSEGDDGTVRRRNTTD